MMISCDIGWCSKFVGLVIISTSCLTRSTQMDQFLFSEEGDASNTNCSQIGRLLNFKELDEVVPAKVPKELPVCSNSTCCGQESVLISYAQTHFNQTVFDTIANLTEIFTRNAAKFDNFFTDLLDRSKHDLHRMFEKTYGLLYQQNSHIFIDLFNNLRSFFKGSNINLDDALDSFFAALMQRLFALLNSQYEFDEEYLLCISKHMDKIKPFGDVPHKLTKQVKRAFVASRIFDQSLQVGRSVTDAISKMDLFPSCSRAVAKMLYCPYCRGLSSVQPCHNYCLNVARGCLANQAGLHSDWTSYIDELATVAELLEGPLNIENVVNPIEIKISDAIINFQQNAETVSSKVFKDCGQPQFGALERKRRETQQSEMNPIRPRPKTSRPVYNHSTTTTVPRKSLGDLAGEIRFQINATRNFWVQISPTICSVLSDPVQNDSSCWNGTELASYLAPVVGDGLINQIKNPEVEFDMERSSTVISQQLLQLKLVTSKLRTSKMGRDISWIDDQDEDEFSAGSASGSGSSEVDFSFHTDSHSQKPYIKEHHRTPPPNHELSKANDWPSNVGVLYCSVGWLYLLLRWLSN